MLAIDIIGLLFTGCLIGLRYPHYVLCAAVVHELGRLMMTLFLHGNPESVVAAGAFSTIVASNVKGGTEQLLIAFSGPLANYIMSSTSGGIENERTKTVLNPCAAVKNPFTVVNLRLAIISFLVSIWHLV